MTGDNPLSDSGDGRSEGVVLSSGEKGPRSQGRRGLVVAILVGLTLAAGGYYWLFMREAPPPPVPAAETPVRTPSVPPIPTTPDAETGAVEITATEEGAVVSVDGGRVGPAPQRVDLGAGSHTVRVEKEGFAAFEREVHIVPGRTLELEARLVRPGPRLSISADVAGAQVFLDREFVGEAPLVIRDVSPGRHRLNVSAKGYDGYREDIEVSAGMNEVHVRLKEVRLDQSLTVKHKHGLGSCRGRLVATTDGLRYETDNEKDRFSLPFSSLEPLEVDYLGKNLRVKARGGRTYNFTADDADDLLIFQRAVEEARSRLP
jgi:hypothetical protein